MIIGTIFRGTPSWLKTGYLEVSPMVKRQDNGAVILCDICGIEAPPAKEILAAHGLIRLGWYCSGGRHRCPQCEHPEDKHYG